MTFINLVSLSENASESEGKGKEDNIVDSILKLNCEKGMVFRQGRTPEGFSRLKSLILGNF